MNLQNVWEMQQQQMMMMIIIIIHKMHKKCTCKHKVKELQTKAVFSSAHIHLEALICVKAPQFVTKE
jgi:metal-responsive CopG/Arc/MetJ family transcriptional regulator